MGIFAASSVALVCEIPAPAFGGSASRVGGRRTISPSTSLDVGRSGIGSSEVIGAYFIGQDGRIITKTLQNLIEIVAGNVSVGHQPLLRLSLALPIGLS